MNKKLNILLLSSLSPYKSANLGMDIIKSLQESGHNVDFITKHKFDAMSPKMDSVYNYAQPTSGLPFYTKLKKRFPFLRYLNPRTYLRRQNNKHIIVNKIENKPPIDPQLIIDKIQHKYDLVITLFWQYMMSAKTLKELYDSLKCPILIYAVDMFPITGGCFYFWDCKNFLKSCGRCPALNSNDENDQTHENFMLKKDIYSNIEYVYIGNSWMCNWAEKSPLINSNRIERGGIVIDQNTFLNRNKIEAKTLLKTNPNKKFILFTGASNIQTNRKGFSILVKSINDFASNLTLQERNEVLLMLAGTDSNDMQKYFDIDVCGMGYLNTNELALTYAAADIYLSTTIEDAGPSMVNQSLMCGTPVVAFEIGVALDIVLTGTTGYRAKYGDIEDYSKGIRFIYNLDKKQKEKMHINCREIALKESSFSSFSNLISKIYEKYSF